MQDLQNAFSNMDASVVMWVAIALGSLFILIVTYDSIRRKRERKRTHSSGRRRHSSSERVHRGSYIQRMRELFHAVNAEAFHRRHPNREYREYQEREP